MCAAKNLFGGERLLAVAGGVGRDLRCLGAAVPAFFELLFDLPGARAGSVKILLRVAFDLRCAAPAGFDFIAETAELVGERGLIDGGRILLAFEEGPLLQGAGRTVLPARSH